MKKILILSNHHSYTYNFRKEVISAFLENDYEVTIAMPYGEKVEDLISMGCKFVDVKLNRRGTNPLEEIQLIFAYYKLIKKINPQYVISYTVKPNLYGGLISQLLNKKFIPNITGLGTALGEKSILQLILIRLYKISYFKSHTIFFQNEENMNFFENKKIGNSVNYQLIPGSGVNLKEYVYKREKTEKDTVDFIYISRIMKEKGIEDYLSAAKIIKKKYPHVSFHVCGFCESDYLNILENEEILGNITYHGLIDNVPEYLSKMDCIIHPTYYPEGISNVLLESAATGLPIITTDRSGTKEVVDNGITGYLIKERNVSDLVEKIELFLGLSERERILMGLNGRRKVEKEFDRSIIVEKYLNSVID